MHVDQAIEELEDPLDQRKLRWDLALAWETHLEHFLEVDSLFALLVLEFGKDLEKLYVALKVKANDTLTFVIAVIR